VALLLIGTQEDARPGELPSPLGALRGTMLVEMQRAETRAAAGEKVDGRQDGEVTGLLAAWRAGDASALSRLMPLVYGELRRLAAHVLAGERTGHTLQATALVHEAYLRLAAGGAPRLGIGDRAHFFAVAAQVMRRLLVDHARGRAAAKRGGGAALVPLTPGISAAVPGVTAGSAPEDLLALDAALTDLAALDGRKARAIELRYFAGSTIGETAAALEVSTATVILDLRLARAWLYRRLRGVP
jgi:RNA polymerase sigma factor (TIGR02999 family)